MPTRVALPCLVAVLALAAACQGPRYEEPKYYYVGGRPIQTGPGPVEVENSELLLPGDGAYHHNDRYLSAKHEDDFLIVRRGLEGPEPNVHVSEQVPGNEQAVLAGGSGRSSQVYIRTTPPAPAIDLPVHGRVLQIDRSGWTALLSLSRGQPVRPGDHVTILRDGRFIGYARLMEVADNGSTALLLDAPDTTPAKPGDAVSYYTIQGG